MTAIRLVIRLVLLMIIAFLHYEGKAQFSSAQKSMLFDSVVTYAEKFLSQENINGASIALVDATGIVAMKGLGFTDPARLEKITPNTLFYIASVTKQITALTFQRVRRLGKIQLTDKVIKVYPDFTMNCQWKEVSDKITLEQLLTHRSGLVHEAPLGGNYDLRPCTFEEHITSFKDSWIKYSPGTQYSYSNMGYDLLGYCLQRISKKPFQEIVREQVLSPLHMSNTYFDVSLIPATASLSKGYYYGTEIPASNKSMLPSGSLYSNVIDLSAVLKVYLSEGQLNNTQFLNKHWLSDAGVIRNVTEGQIMGYGIGWEIRQSNDFKEIFQSGSGFGFTSRLTLLPAMGLGLVILCNADEVGFCERLSAYLIDEAYKLKHNKNRPKQLLSKAQYQKPDVNVLKKISGTYKGYYGLNHLRVSGDTLVWVRGRNKIILQDAGNGVFLTPGNEKFIFHFKDNQYPDFVEYLSEFQTDRWFPNQLTNNTFPSEDSIYTAEKYLGNYQAMLFGVQPFGAVITLKEGKLQASRYGGVWLRYYKDGIFFSADGESFVFKNDALLIGNRPFYKISEDK